MKHESRFGAHIGTSSLLLIFLTLSLVSFGSLSLAGAKADERLSDKLYDHTTQYYAANHEAERFVAITDGKLRQAYAASADAADFYARTENLARESAIAMNDTQTLAVALEFVYPMSEEAADADGSAPGDAAAADSLPADDGAAPRLYRITKWRIENRDDASYERHLPVSTDGGVD